MKRFYTIISAAVLLFSGCEEFQPVFTGTYADPEYVEPVNMVANTTIAELKDKYVQNGRKPVVIVDDLIIAGQVTTSDQVGNFYKTFYIQDESAGIEIKVGKNGLYNEYKIGQWVYVKCAGLTVGDYHGMINIGYQKDVDSEYETSYLEHSYLIDNHIFKGPMGEEVLPKEITASELSLTENLGRYVTIRDLTYANEILLLFYHNPNLSGAKKKEAVNRFFASTDQGEAPKTYNVTTWALSEQLFKKHLYAGDFDDVERQDDAKKTSDYKTVDENGNVTYDIIPTAYSVSQYFNMAGKQVQVRSSGFARFSDLEIDPEVRAGNKKVDFTGILTEYDSKAQFTIIDMNGVVVHD